MMFRSLLLSFSLLGFLAGGAVMAMEDENSTPKPSITPKDPKDINNNEKEKHKNQNNERALNNFEGFKQLPEPLKKRILVMAIYQQTFETGKSPGNIEATCREFRDIIATDTQDFNNDRIPTEPSNTRRYFIDGLKVHYHLTTPKEVAIFEQFYKGKLIYRPNPPSDKGKIELRIADLHNPLEGTFDLSKCGDTGKYLSISTGYRKGIKAENKNKLEIWLAPRFMIDKKLNSSASHLQPIMDNWKEETAPIGILWSWGGWNDLSWYDYLTSKTTREISSKNLHYNWLALGIAFAHSAYPNYRSADDRITLQQARDLHDFMFIFEPK